METKIKKTTKIVEKKAEAKKVLKTTAKPEVAVKTKAAVVKTMKNRSGLHVKNPRRVESKEINASIKAAIVDVTGASKGNMTLPSEIFGATPNKALIAQAVRVYLANQRTGTASTQTRGEVIGSTRKIYRQKGTGRARHGAIKAPIFVGGGVAHGPHPHDFGLDFPKKMRKAALISALSQKAQEGAIRVVEGDFSGKTKEVAKLFKTMELAAKGKVKRVLLVTDGNENATRGAQNIGGVEIETAATVSTYIVMVSRNIIFLKNSVDVLQKRLAKN